MSFFRHYSLTYLFQYDVGIQRRRLDLALRGVPEDQGSHKPVALRNTCLAQKLRIFAQMLRHPDPASPHPQRMGRKHHILHRHRTVMVVDDIRGSEHQYEHGPPIEQPGLGPGRRWKTIENGI